MYFLKKLEVLSEFDVRIVRTRVRGFNLSKRRFLPLIFIVNRQIVGFLQAGLSSIFRHKLIVTYWALMKHQALKIKRIIITFFIFKS